MGGRTPRGGCGCTRPAALKGHWRRRGQDAPRRLRLRLRLRPAGVATTAAAVPPTALAPAGPLAARRGER